MKLKDIAIKILKENKYYITDLGHYFRISLKTKEIKPKRFTVWNSQTNQPIESSNDIGYLMNKYKINKVYGFKQVA